MCHKFFGIFDSYTVMLILAVLFAIGLAILFLKHKKFNKAQYLDITICALGGVLLGVVFAILFQNLYDLIEYKSDYEWHFKLTFFGGLFGGVIGFLLTYNFLSKKNTTLEIRDALKIAPGCVALAHAIGRIGCFLSPCCYGKADETYGIYFPELGYKAIPTQMYEFIFLFILAGILIYLAFKKDWDYSFVVYLVSYSIFRFIIEFYRGDDRGADLGPFSPSQIWCLLIIILIVPITYLANKYLIKKKVI